MSFYYVQQTIEKRIRIMIEEREAELSNGKCSDYSEYKKTVGIIYGLKLAVQIINEIHIEDEI